MKEEDKEYIRAFAAMFAMAGILMDKTDKSRGPIHVVEEAFKHADVFMGAFDSDISGIASIKPKKKYERKA